MKTKNRRIRPLAGMTLIEIMAAIVIISIAVIGASGYRYYSTLDARRATNQSTAARIALLLSENWRGLGYDRTADFDPPAHLSPDMDVAASEAGPDYAEGFTPLNRYEIVANNAQFWAALSYRDEAADLRTLNTVVAWKGRPGITSDSGDISMDKTFKLTTFVAD